MLLRNHKITKLKPHCNNIWLDCNLTMNITFFRTILSQLEKDQEENEVDITTIIDLSANSIVKWNTWLIDVGIIFTTTLWLSMLLTINIPTFLYINYQILDHLPHKQPSFNFLNLLDLLISHLCLNTSQHNNQAKLVVALQTTSFPYSFLQNYNPSPYYSP